MHSKHWISALALTAGLVMGGIAQAQTTVRIAWYSDGNEGEVVSDLLKRFEAQNKDIKVVLDQVPYKAITENLPVQLASGQGPDIARVVDLGGIARYALDLRPYLKDAAYWDKNFGPFLPWMRPAGDSGISSSVFRCSAAARSIASRNDSGASPFCARSRASATRRSMPSRSVFKMVSSFFLMSSSTEERS